MVHNSNTTYDNIELSDDEECELTPNSEMSGGVHLFAFLIKIIKMTLQKIVTTTT